MIAEDQDLNDILGRGHALMSRERDMFMAGNFGLIEQLTAEKQALLTDLEAVLPQVRGTPAVREALSALIRDSQRNEQIIFAAKQGVAAARRRVEQVMSTRRGAVAYDRQGKKITSSVDGYGKSSCA